MLTSLKDGYPGFIERNLKHHDILVLLVCLVSFVVGIPYIFQGGIYVFQIVDYYAAAISLMFIAFFEIISVVWFYGTGRLSANIKDMTGDYPNKLFRFCWIVVSPLLIAAIWIFSIVDYKPVTYKKAIGGEYFYPDWAIAPGWCITATSFVPIPFLAIYNIYKAKADGIWNKFILSLKSKIERCPCGCEVGLDENYEAHSNSRFSLIGECGTEDIKMKADL
jgi:solute carrier family 6 GABA transporter-like protein 6/8/11/12/13